MLKFQSTLFAGPGVETPVDGGWSSYGNWSKCSAECGGGTKTRSRKCDNPEPSFGGKDCEGDTTETKPCNPKPCIGKLLLLMLFYWYKGAKVVSP